ncbi:MAG: glycosyltransferase family 2 protein [Candidatus Levybacteria bacterium]|nr:glycosyltransferase family 2 protein [Candidatus Levybacteria bacterium]
MKKIISYRQPTISVVIATFNSQNTIRKCLESVRNQDYDQKKIEIILADGGSQDKTLSIVEKYHPEIIDVPKDKQNAEYNKGEGLMRAKGEFVLMIDHDNVLPHKKWLENMLTPLLEHKEIVASETLRYHYDPKFSLLDRYFALFGAGDPLAFYLGKADRLSYIYEKYNLLGKAKHCGNYYIVKFDRSHIPTLGANGFLIRRKLLVENAKVSDGNFYHIDVNVDLIRKNFNTYAFIDDTIIHLTGYKKISSFLYRRKLFMEQFYLAPNKKRRYSVYTSKDKLKLLVYIFYSITFVKPTIDAIRGYIKVRDGAWFFHPVLAFSLCMIYGYTAIKSKLISL